MASNLFQPTFRYGGISNPNLTAGAELIMKGLGTPGKLSAQIAKDERQAMLDAQEQQRYADKVKRQAALDAQNKQLFDLKMTEADRMEKARQDEEAYLRGITQPDAYGLRAGTNQVVEALGQYGENPRAKAALAAGQGSAEYEQYFKEMENLGDLITGQSVDDRAIGFATANPDNVYAAREALKAGVGRQAALDAEAKNLADKKTQIALKTITAGGTAGAGTGKAGKTAGGYSVKDPGSVLKDAFSLVKTQYGKKAGDKIHPKVAEQASLMANAGYDAAQIAKAVNEAYTPKKVEKFLGIDWLNPDSASKFDTTDVKLGTPRNVAVNNASKAAQVAQLAGLGKSYDDRLTDVEKQRKGEVGLSELEKIIGGASKSTPSKKEVVKDVVKKVTKEDKTNSKETDEAVKKVAEKVVNAQVGNDTNSAFKSDGTVQLNNLDQVKEVLKVVPKGLGEGIKDLDAWVKEKSYTGDRDLPKAIAVKVANEVNNFVKNNAPSLHNLVTGKDLVSGAERNAQNEAQKQIAFKLKSGEPLSASEQRWYESMQNSPGTRNTLKQLGLNATSNGAQEGPVTQEEFYKVLEDSNMKEAERAYIMSQMQRDPAWIYNNLPNNPNIPQEVKDKFRMIQSYLRNQ